MIKIDGINTEVGLKRASGSNELFMQNLSSLHNQLARQCDKLETFFNSGDVHNFMVLVHGMKSLLATVGALGASEKAQKLENASKDADMVYCRDNLPEFLRDTRKLYEQLSLLFPKKEKKAGRPAGDGKALLLGVEKALAASKDCDMDTAETEIKKLLAYDYGEENDELLENAYASVENFDFDTANEYITQILDINAQRDL